MKTITTDNSYETKKLGENLAAKMINGGLVCLAGELGSGKTTFTQGLLRGLKVGGNFSSPTFVIMKKYRDNIFHLDAYRVESDDIINLGWREIVSDKKNIIIVEWADRIKNIIPKEALWINFEWIDKDRRRLSFNK
ncbi:MAG TPA: tRNA (adenosine(37)-N6)-threonylcarbamoyltransferase complex ATPase subunit type 1 TsaE [Patescibacteria group bacterium]|nr:tRNA (adenosine(37)-N6)-threonylcarbamoyltransferase complex ATPase subunit type 1 TsaE [Patescibacteria group bacterium]